MSTGLNFPRGAEISFLFTTQREIRKFHGRFLGDPSATDVITFCHTPCIDIVISIDQAKAQAKKRALPLLYELILLMLHGLLHAKGFDDTKPSKRLEMRCQEFEWLSRIL